MHDPSGEGPKEIPMSEHRWMSAGELAAVRNEAAIWPRPAKAFSVPSLLADLAETKAIIANLTVALWGDQWNNLQLVRYADLRERIRAVPGVVEGARSADGEE